MKMSSTTWPTLPIKNIYKGLYDGPHATPRPAVKGPIFLGIKNVTEDGQLDLVNVRHIAEDDFADWTRRVQPQENDLVFTYEATLNRYALIPDGFRGCLGRRMALIRPNLEVVDVKYLFYYFFTDEWRSVIRNNMLSGSTVDRIPLTGFPDFPVRIPPLPIQRRIAGILSAYDDLIENSQRRIKILEEMARRLYREWFVHFRFPGHEDCRFVESPLGVIPEGWEVKAFTEFADVLSGGTPKTDVAQYWDGEIPFFTPRDAPDCFYLQDTDKHVSDIGLSKCASALYPPDTVFITARGTVGKVALPAVNMAMNQSCYALRGKNGVTQRFLFLMTLQQVDYLKTNTGGATFDTIVVDTFRRMEVVSPARAIASQFSELIDPVFVQVNTLQCQIRNLRRTRDLLLPRLLSGQIDVEALPEPVAFAP
jgi:type I restriction enzyme S subunit